MCRSCNVADRSHAQIKKGANLMRLSRLFQAAVFVLLWQSPAQAACQMVAWSGPAVPGKLGRALCSQDEALSAVETFGRQQCGATRDCIINFWDRSDFVPKWPMNTMADILGSAANFKALYECKIASYASNTDKLEKSSTVCTLRK